MIYAVSAALAAALLVLGMPGEALAMHISEGILPLGWSLLWYAASLPFIFWGLVRLKGVTRAGDRNIRPLLGLVAAAVFIFSCMPIPVPTAGSCSHPAGTAMAAILVGPVFGVLASGVALMLQALFLAHGGVSTWGANVFSMGVIGSFAGFFTFFGLRRLRVPLVAAAFFAGVAGDWATYAATSFELAAALAGPGEFRGLFYAIAAAFTPTQLPLGLLEGAVTAGAVRFIFSRDPELVGGALKPAEPGGGPAAHGGARA